MQAFSYFTQNVPLMQADSESIGSSAAREESINFDVAFELTECENSVRVLQVSKYVNFRV